MTHAEYRRRRREEWDAAGKGYATLGAELKELMGPVTEWILELADLRSGERVLDIATGPGSPALEVAQQVGSGGRVVGVDFAPSMLEVASRRAMEGRFDIIQFLEMDAERHAIRDGTFDVVLSRYGFPHCADAAMALREACRVLRPGGRLVAGHHGRPERNPYLSLPVRVLSRYQDGTAVSASESVPGSAAPGPFGHPTTEHFEGALREAGFGKVEVVARELTVKLADFAGYWEAQKAGGAAVRRAFWGGAAGPPRRSRSRGSRGIRRVSRW